jgi:hypothetical protein
MSLSEEHEAPGGVEVVTEWVDTLYGSSSYDKLWTSLDAPLRLALAQGWVMWIESSNPELVSRDEREATATQLASENSDHRLFREFQRALIDRWRVVYSMLEPGYGILAQTNIVGVQLELVVLTALEHVGKVEAAQQIPVHSFITRLDGSNWTIAALARRLPVPGWPPPEATVPGL